jgi:molecular chaperone GrpE
VSREASGRAPKARKRAREAAEPPEKGEGWEGPSEEEPARLLSSSPELEEALRAAAQAVEEREVSLDRPLEPASAEGEVERLRSELIDARDQFLRLRADFDNFRKRALREREEASLYGHQNLVKDLLSTVDNLERAIDHSRKNGGGDLEGLLQGVELVQRELLGALGQHGVTQIEALGAVFDPAIHEAMAQAPDGSVEPNTVIDVLQKGYLLRDRLVRPARVVVARAPEGDEDTGGGGRSAT